MGGTLIPVKDCWGAFRATDNRFQASTVCWLVCMPSDLFFGAPNQDLQGTLVKTPPPKKTKLQFRAQMDLDQKISSQA